ncbi:MAG: BolA family protein [Candidatus Oxydemutatoraceae bacterium WSBS_2016_MAG_OTU14]
MSIQQIIESKIRTSKLVPEHLEVINESDKHNVPEGSESHFKLIIVSAEFSRQSLINRHRMVNEVLAEELANNIHALALRTLSPEEWVEKGQSTAPTPPCLGGSKNK